MRVFLGKNLNTKLQFVKIRVELLKLFECGIWLQEVLWKWSCW